MKSLRSEPPCVSMRCPATVFQGDGTPLQVAQIDFHRLALSGNDVPDSLLDVLIFPQPSRASMARPTLSIRSFAPRTVQRAAGVRLESVHDHFGAYVGFYDGMNVIRSHVRGPKTPAAVHTNLAHRTKDGALRFSSR